MIRQWSNTALRWGMGLATFLVASAAWSQSVGETTSATAPLEGQRNIGVLLAIGSYHGFGGGVQLGTPQVGLRAAAGWVPILASYEAPDEDPTFKLYSSYQLAGDVYARAMEAKRGSNVGLSCGYRYNDVLGSGVALGGYGSFRLNKALDGFVQLGLLWFFSGEEQLRENAGDEIPEDADFGWPGPSVNYSISLGLLLFP